MGRLIDADKLVYDEITDKHGDTFMIVHAPEIDNAPTAYDVEAVVKKLEQLKLIRIEQCHEDYELEVMTESILDDAIKIVRNGGVK